MTKNSMILHCGGYAADDDAVRNVVTPEATGTHHPMDHTRLINETVEAVNASGLEVVNANHALVDQPLRQGEVKHIGARYFGLLDVRPKNGVGLGSDHGLAIGMRNTHDKSYCASLVAGTRVFVCDNLGFSGEVMLSRRHTSGIFRDLPRLVTDAFGKIIEHNQKIEEQIEIFKTSTIDNRRMHDIVCKAVRCNAIPNRTVPSILQQWYQPAHDVFRARTAWSALNAVTEVAKSWKNPTTKTDRTMRFHTLLAQELSIAV